MEHSCDPSVQEAEEDQKLKVSLGCLARLCLKKKKNDQGQRVSSLLIAGAMDFSVLQCCERTV